MDFIYALQLSWVQRQKPVNEREACIAETKIAKSQLFDVTICTGIRSGVKEDPAMNQPTTLHSHQTDAAVSRSNTKPAAAFAISVISGTMLILVVVLLPSLLSAAAGLFIFVGLPLTLLSIVLQMIGTGLLISERQASSSRLYILACVSAVLCWIATLLIGLLAIVAFAMMSA